MGNSRDHTRGIPTILDISGDDDGSARRALRASYFRSGELKAALNKDLQTDRQKHNVMRTLVDRAIIRAGLTLPCDECGYSNWLELGRIDDLVTCDRCLQTFRFPHGSPPDRDRWAYRPTGACSVPDYASGSYTVALALRFLDPDHGRMTWCTGTQLSPELEVDFAAVREERVGDDSRITFALGEAKSTNNFTAQDFERASQVRKRMPDATLVFATLNEQLREDEKAGIAALARPVCRRPTDVHFDARVLVLTRRELLSLEGAPDCWADTPYAARSTHGPSELAQWADLTLQLHVGLEPQADWVKAQYDRFGTAGRRLTRGGRQRS